MATIAAFHNSFGEGLVTVDRAWIARNIGVDPTSIPLPPAAFARRVAASPNASLDDLQREIIDFDSEGSEGAAFLAFTKATGLSRFVDIPWPKGLAPTPATRAPAGGAKPLPRADVLIVTWTVDEGHALSRVLTPGKDSRNDYVPYTHNYAALAKQMSKGSPAVEAKQLGAFWTTTIGTKKVVVLKSDSHLSQDTDKHFPANGQLPNAEFWKQIIGEVQPKLVLTTGTAGGIGKDCEVGDVVVSPIVRFDSTSWLKKAPFAAANYASQNAKTTFFSEAKTLFKANASQLPADNTRPPAITVVKPSGLSQSVVTTDFFGFDTSDNHFKLQGLGDVSEMGDAVLGMVAQSLGESAPPWLAIRNVSDPEIAAEGTLKQQAQAAATIYKAYGRWSSVCSAIVCWAAVAAL
jgi:purine-nucleoside phosphorylase